MAFALKNYPPDETWIIFNRWPLVSGAEEGRIPSSDNTITVSGNIERLRRRPSTVEPVGMSTSLFVVENSTITFI
jgi:hypothetical protein